MSTAPPSIHPQTDPPHEDAPAHPHPDEHGIPTDLKQPSNVTVVIAALIFLALLTVLFFVGYIPHEDRQRLAAADAADVANELPAVTVEHPRQENSANDNLLLPADVRADQETAIYPRTNGYLKAFYADLGDRVTAGKLLAVIDTPEIDAQLAEARASVVAAQAGILKDQTAMSLARRTWNRYDDYYKAGTGGVTQQQLDETKTALDSAQNALALDNADVTVAAAEVQRLAALQDFEKITAPFTGVITARNYDVGALLSANGSGQEIFHIVQTDTLRVFVSVPQSYATSIRTGQAAYLTVRNYPGRKFTGTVARSTGALDPATRTLAFQLDFPNPNGELYAGMYAQAQIPVVQESVLVIPASALLFNADGSRVAVVDDGHVRYQTITIGRDFGKELEVLTGLSVPDQVVVTPSEKLTDGGAVRVMTVASPAPATRPAP